ncbi:hypothetical protein OSTOST_05753 [Ostertagia ostertagi]
MCASISKVLKASLADDVQKSDRFAVQGMALLTSVHILADTYDNDFWDIFEKFLEKRKPLTADQKAALDAMGTRFNDEAQKQWPCLRTS